MAEKSEVQEKTAGFGALAPGLACAGSVIATGSLLAAKVNTLAGDFGGIIIAAIGGLIAAFVIHAYANPKDS